MLQRFIKAMMIRQTRFQINAFQLSDSVLGLGEGHLQFFLFRFHQNQSIAMFMEPTFQG